MKTVYKYYLRDETTTISLPQGSKVVCVNEQDERATIWVEQDTELPSAYFKFHIIPTGGDIPEYNVTHVGTCFIGRYVWHIYQEL